MLLAARQGTPERVGDMQRPESLQWPRTGENGVQLVGDPSLSLCAVPGSQKEMQEITGSDGLQRNGDFSFGGGSVVHRGWEIDISPQYSVF